MGKSQDPDETLGDTDHNDGIPKELHTLECPANFGVVASNIYRSSFPRPEHFPFLRQLGLKSILVLLSDDYPDLNLKFMEEQGIQLLRVGLPGNKEPFIKVEPSEILPALRILLDKRNHPILVHCNQGKHRTGCVVGCLRRTQDWALSLIFDEYRRYAWPKARALDQLLIELFQPEPEADVSFLWS